MRIAKVLAFCVALTLLLAGCDPNDKAYFRSGVGTELYTADTATAADLQNAYLESLCRQAMPFVGIEVPSCSQQRLQPTEWPLLVQAGMNDIDQRCDSYLSWLDQRKRENAAILAEVSAIRVAVDALTNPAITSVSPIALASVAAAFGLATSTLGNVNSLLLQVDHTTVQSVVFINRRNFREKVLDLAITNKPMVVHALRSYLTICMPMTISANINSTVTVFQQAGAGALDQQQLVSTTTLGAPQRATGTAGGRTERRLTGHPEFAPFFVGYTANNFPFDTIKLIQDVLCVPTGEVGRVGLTFSRHIAIFEESDLPPKEKRKVTPDGKIDVVERDIIMSRTKCSRDVARNFYERQLDPDGTRFIMQLLNRKKPTGLADLPETSSLAAARERISLVRRSLEAAGTISKLPESMSNQWTRDLFEALATP